jgi:hypothetical protein
LCLRPEFPNHFEIQNKIWALYKLIEIQSLTLLTLLKVLQISFQTGGRGHINLITTPILWG